MATISPNGFGSPYFTGMELEAEAQFVLRRLLTALPSPADRPRIVCVISAAVSCVREFGSTLSSPNETFCDLLQGLEALNDQFQRAVDDDLSNPLFRMVSQFPAWGLFLDVSRLPHTQDLLRSTGRELALALIEDRPFRNSFAKNLRTIIGSGNKRSGLLKAQISAEKHDLKMSATGHAAFETNPNTGPKVGSDFPFQVRARQHIARKVIYETPRHRQGMLDRHSLNIHQIEQGANELRDLSVKGNHDAILMCLAFSCGLSLELTIDLPLYSAAIDDWFMVLDVESGSIKTNVESLAPNHATPSKGVQSALREASHICVKPLPAFLHEQLHTLFQKSQQPNTVRDLLNTATGDFTFTKNAESAIPCTTARFLNSSSGLALQAGINRFTACFVTNDFSSAPASKIYYGHIEYWEIWDGCRILYKSLNWGEPAPVAHGLAVGALVVPSRESISDLFGTMAKQVFLLRPGKRTTLNALVNYHNAFAAYCASLAAFCLASREAKVFQYMADTLHSDAAFLPMDDKGCGPFSGALPLAANEVLRTQLYLWEVHSRALASRLVKFEFPTKSKLTRYIDQIVIHDPVPLFFRVTNLKPVPLGSSDLQSSWPENLRLNANFGRSFWECELKTAGMESSKVDMVLRHMMTGVESSSSTSMNIQSGWGREVCEIQERLLQEMAILPVQGLTKR